jgi:hypothetical protein
MQVDSSLIYLRAMFAGGQRRSASVYEDDLAAMGDVEFTSCRRDESIWLGWNGTAERRKFDRWMGG